MDVDKKREIADGEHITSCWMPLSMKNKNIN